MGELLENALRKKEYVDKYLEVGISDTDQSDEFIQTATNPVIPKMNSLLVPRRHIQVGGICPPPIKASKGRKSLKVKQSQHLIQRGPFY